MDASYKIQRGIHVHLIQFFMCPEFWVHINCFPRFVFGLGGYDPSIAIKFFATGTIFGIKNNSRIVFNTGSSIICNHPICVSSVFVNQT